MPATPTARTFSAAPTDTVIAQHVQNIRVPETVAKEYREKHLGSRDGKGKPVSFSSRTKNLTLKEQNSKIDKLSKENFDLKLKIHFLDQALQNRSEEGVKDMINKNVQLQTDLANERKANQELRRRVRELERKMKAQEEGFMAKSPNDENSPTSEKQLELEEEVEYLREIVHHNELEIEKLRQDNISKEFEKRKMAELYKSMGERTAGTSEPNGSTEVSIPEERRRSKASERFKLIFVSQEAWRDLYESEVSRREQADEDAQRLREEIKRLREETQSSTTNNHVRNVYHVSRRQQTSYTA